MGFYTKKAIKIILVTFFILLLFNVIDYYKIIEYPVDLNSETNFDSKSYWHYPWGENKVHKGIDIFGELNTPIQSPVNGIILNTGFSNNGGNHIYLISYDLKIYYFAHLSKCQVNFFDFISCKKQIGLMGDSGNAKYSPIHLHFSIFSAIPLFKNFDNKSYLGWQKIFYPDPESYFKP